MNVRLTGEFPRNNKKVILTNDIFLYYHNILNFFSGPTILADYLTMFVALWLLHGTKCGKRGRSL